MFEVAELGLKLSRQEFDEKVPALHTRLLQAQRELLQSRHSAIILVSGVEGAGKGEVVNRLNEWLDSRGMETNAFWDETDEQMLRPRYWRYWRAMPPRGRIGIMFGSWYTMPIVERVYGRIEEGEYERQLKEIADFERMLSKDGIIMIKLWYHMPKARVEKQLKADAKNPKLKMRSSPWNNRYSRLFEKFLKVSEVALRSTDQGSAPWHVVEATDVHHRDYTTGQIILDMLRQHLAPSVPPAPVVTAKTPASKVPKRKELTVLDILSPDITLGEELYRRKLLKWQTTLHELAWNAHETRRSVVLVFEGWDAAGKGSTIRRVTQGIDARLYKVIYSAAPTDEEAAHHYLWRFWRNIPLAGYISIYDRSWYGRVLVERVEKFTAEEDWRRAYNEINLFEQQLTDHGIILLKFWLHLSPEEQLRRFREREQTPWKQHKINAEDWRNRDKWDEYKLAVHDMVAHTSSAAAPWHLIPANDKKYARIDVLKTVCKTLKKEL
jgi:polyphosphate:AMP phosphotransferase